PHEGFAEAHGTRANRSPGEREEGNLQNDEQFRVTLAPVFSAPGCTTAVHLHQCGATEPRFRIPYEDFHRASIRLSEFRWTPRILAASLWLPLTRSMMRSTTSRSNCSEACFRGSRSARRTLRRRSGRRTSRGGTSSSTSGPSAKTTQRSITFWSSRTLPGHRYSFSAVSASWDNPSTRLLNSRV